MTKICPKIRGVVLSTDVAENENNQDNNVVLSEKKLLDSFEKEGFIVKRVIYDKYSTCKDDNSERRITREFPDDYCKKTGVIVATYYFAREAVDSRGANRN